MQGFIISIMFNDVWFFLAVRDDYRTEFVGVLIDLFY